MAEMNVIRFVVIVDQLFTRSKSGAVWGRIYFEIDEGQFFPNREWTDLVAAFSRGWLDCLLQLAQGTTLRSTVPFYDGPFQVDIVAYSPGLVKLSFLGREDVRHSATAAIDALLKDGLSAAEKVLRNCQQLGWNNQDTEALETLLMQGANALARLGGA